MLYIKGIFRVYQTEILTDHKCQALCCSHRTRLDVPCLFLIFSLTIASRIFCSFSRMTLLSKKNTAIKLGYFYDYNFKIAYCLKGPNNKWGKLLLASHWIVHSNDSLRKSEILTAYINWIRTVWPLKNNATSPVLSCDLLLGTIL